MSISIHVVGYRAPDSTWHKMKAIWDACKTGGIRPPREVEKFFDDGEPDKAGIIVDLIRCQTQTSVSQFNADMREGYEVNLENLRREYPNLTTIRFYVSF